MAVVRVGIPHHYVGLSTDPKPTADVPAGSRFFERDTGFEFIFDGIAWGKMVFPAT